MGEGRVRRAGRPVGGGPVVVVVAGTLVLAACGGGGSGGERLAAGERPGQETTTTTGAPAEIGEDGHVVLACPANVPVESVIVDYLPDATTFATPELALEAGRKMENDSLRRREAEAAAHGVKPASSASKPAPLRYEPLASSGRTDTSGGEKGVVFVGRDETGAPVASVTVVRARDGRWIAEMFEMCSDRIAKGGEF